jgi:hypothetical protein
MTDELRSFLELNLPKPKEGKKAKYSLGVVEPKVGSHISEVTGIPCQSNEFVQELLRGVRLHFDRFIKDLKVKLFFLPSQCEAELCTYDCRTLPADLVGSMLSGPKLDSCCTYFGLRCYIVPAELGLREGATGSWA